MRAAFDVVPFGNSIAPFSGHVFYLKGRRFRWDSRSRGGEGERLRLKRASSTIKRLFANAYESHAALNIWNRALCSPQTFPSLKQDGKRATSHNCNRS